MTSSPHREPAHGTKGGADKAENGEIRRRGRHTQWPGGLMKENTQRFV